MESTVNFGLLTLLPPIVIIAIALTTRRTFEALIVGAVIAFIMSDKMNFMNAFLEAVTNVVTDNAWMWITLGLFGSFVALLTKSKGTYGFSKVILRFANGQRRSMLWGWVLSWIVFMDDYLNILTVSAAMKNISDRTKNPREMLAYIIDSTGAPACVIIPLSTWAVFFGGVFADEQSISSLGSGTWLYLHAIPFIFYAWVAVFIVPLVILGVIPRIFGMKKAYDRVESGGNPWSDRSAKYNEKQDNTVVQDGNIWNFLLPIILLVIVTIAMGDLLLGLVYAIILQLILYIVTKTLNFNDFMEQVTEGFAGMIPMLFICVGALTVKIAMDGIGLPAYIINAVLPYMTPVFFPAITFVIVASLSFVTGSNWGIPAVTVPIIAPLAVLSGASVPMTLGAIVSGGAFGSHACFYSDATVLTSQASGIDNLEHAFSQLPYAVIGAIIAIILYIVFGIALT